MGAVILGALALYLLVSIAVVKWAIRYARKHEKNTKLWGFGAAFLMYNLVFWDWIPTVVVHKYYCATEVGFWVYKTLDQWKAENPGVLEGLHQIIQPTQRMPYGSLDILDERFAIESHRQTPISLLPTRITEMRLIDRSTGEALAKAVDVGSGVGYIATGGSFKFWLNQKACTAKGFWALTAQLERMRGKK